MPQRNNLSRDPFSKQRSFRVSESSVVRVKTWSITDFGSQLLFIYLFFFFFFFWLIEQDKRNKFGIA